MNITATGINWATNTFSRPGWLFRKEVFILLSAQVPIDNPMPWAESRINNSFRKSHPGRPKVFVAQLIPVAVMFIVTPNVIG